MLAARDPSIIKRTILATIAMVLDAWRLCACVRDEMRTCMCKNGSGVAAVAIAVTILTR